MTDPIEKARAARAAAERALEQPAIEAMAAALPVLARVTATMQDAWHDPPEARMAEALRLAIADLLTSYARPGSAEMAAADLALEDLRPTPHQEDPDA